MGILRRRWREATIALLALVVIGLVAAPREDDQSESSSSTSATVTSTAQVIAATATPTATPARTSTASPTPSPTPEIWTGPVIELSGTGDDVVSFEVPRGEPAIVWFIHGGTRNFAVWGYGPDGERTDLFVNTIGAYEGFRPLNFDEITTEFEIQADGYWAALIAPLANANRATPTTTGTGDDVLIIADLEARTARITNSASRGNVAVWAWGSTRDLLVNEIGAYSGRVRIPTGAQILEITSEGTWEIVFEE